MSEPAAPACDLSALDPQQQRRRLALAQSLHPQIQEWREEEDGYTLWFEASEASILLAAEFLALERLCCPFLDFRVKLPRADARMEVRVASDPGMKPFLAQELGLSPSAAS